MPTLTALRSARAGRVALEVDGRPWRVVPDDVVVRCGLAAGTELDRPRLRELRRELLRAEALGRAARALSRRDLSRRRLAERLRARGTAESTAESVVETLAASGLVDDRRLAQLRARALAERGWGDAAVEARLAQEGVDAEIAQAALAELPPERERAEQVVAAVADPRKAWNLLSRRGFALETVESAVERLDAEGRARLR